MIILCVSIFTTCVYYVVNDSWNFDFVISAVLAVFSLFFLVFLFILVFFHLYLIDKEMTTNEKIKGLWTLTINPFNQLSFFKNFKARIDEFWTKSQFNIKAKVLTYQEDFDANFIHRGLMVSKNFMANLKDLEDPMQTAIVKYEGFKL